MEKHTDGGICASMKFRNHHKLIMGLFIVGIAVSVPLSVFFGSASVSFSDVLNVVNGLFNGNENVDPSLHTIVWNLRVPRVILALACGCGLSVCGVTMQAVTRNVMAEPYTLGVASGASVMAALFITRLEGVVNIPFGVQMFAFIGAILAMVLVYSFASIKSYASNFKLILTGIVIGMVCTAIRELLIATTHNPNKVNAVVLWEMGAFGAARWNNILFPVICAIGGAIFLYIMSEKLNLISVGEETATSLGVSIKTLQRVVLIVTSLLTGAMVASSGIISFVGLIIPHIIRKIVGADNTKVLPLSALSGAFFMIWTDVISRVVIAPEEMAVSILTSLVGGPLLLLLMRKERS